MPRSSKAGTAGAQRAAQISGYWTERQDWSLKVHNKTREISDCDCTASDSPVPRSLPWNDCQALCHDGVFYKYFLITTTYTVCSASGADGSINEAVGCLLPPSSIRLHRDWGYAGSCGAQGSSFLPPHRAWMLSTPVSRTAPAQLMSVCQAFVADAFYLGVLISTK